ncbi:MULTISPECIES: Gfo/Idh/MocA family oxidoreductase [unclassified Mesorhizobium]|uniref:Gfo/Idh/MocA family protein n=1 Tax=unclassified Mesorhizobium TaxID=325217 RepID=UPI000FCA6F5D|nr:MULTISPECIES: Gfo/Idh/MocA family oxidoreductase [unclassified Mesorhizobium]TGR44401.1 Gfo/Idh/MocA family oxidoreductase [bacterium M00.F.Ca.ET.199.01.1.1]TGU33266.1 Gfo/Idh/MocA family oxidoreductase [bacterium M00.F.Ca.ET.156.01.1.1]TGV87469.1 Gfo/Idh/MocA family oxidoreductase [Mesorhizobium sp. M00.F.Ca.ET.149.01.1.1]RUW56765.1 Gfo/Idh/MocA family oxidoreductase [Mesorhizobium sp. M8A.F.Ca.ET.021.01.1.1]TGR27553.1 Gfo/Idh/MocA family oxidoreductase [Mesorhizobium sp. M8A.F.Ca.ET.202.0
MIDAVLVGCGAMSKAWLDAARQIDGLAIVGLVDLDADRAKARAREYDLGGAVIGTSLDAVLDQIRPQAVFDVVVPAARRDVALSAFAHHCNLLTEKPLADSPENARAIVEAARQAGRIHAVVQNRRYVANVRRIRRFLDSGAIGAATSIHADFFVAPHFGGFREEMAHVLLLDMAIHTFDAARYMVNGEPAAVHCQEWEPANSWYRQGSSASAVFDLGGGKVFTYAGSWCAAGFRTSWEGSWRIVAERGSLIWDGHDGLRAEVVVPGRDGMFDKIQPIEVPALDPADRVDGHLGIIRDFMRAIETGTEPETRGADNIKSLAMVFGAIESAETGRRVMIAEEAQ